MTRRAADAPQYESEAELCAVFRLRAEREGFIPYPETAGWDLLLVCERTKQQIGVQAKLRGNLEVLAQALAYGGESYPGPDYHAVLVPWCSSAFWSVAKELRLVVFDMSETYLRAGKKEPLRFILKAGTLWKHTDQCTLPEIRVDVPAGVPAPRSVTPWKIAAVKLALLLKRQGFLTGADFKAAKVDRRWFTESRRRNAKPMVERVPGTYPHQYTRTVDGAPLPDELWPEITVALEQQAGATS